MSDPFQHLIVSERSGLLSVTVDREEKRNALSLEVLGEIRALFESCSEDRTIKAATITGKGEKSFAAGGDLRELDSVRTVEDSRLMSESGRTALDAIRNFPVPVVAVLDGTALGGGAELAMACDFRLATPNASIGFLQGTLNITTAWGGGPDLIERIGSAPALRLIATAKVLKAPEALEIGVVDALADESQALDAAVGNFMEPMLARLPHVLRAMKALRLAAKKRVLDGLAELETGYFVDCWTDDAHWEAADAVLGGRK
ncbi:MAG: enoyl-CoA hydratase/isomerase family protein [Gammaproteobacteria bacterium]|nr:enoyl-CoA hydratase/isomerase family protein [Gammaproteobacteria bacterium]